ncbi:glycosyltransferase family 2 protein [Methylobacterium sp. A52T]
MEFLDSRSGTISNFLMPSDGELYPIVLDLTPISHAKISGFALESASSGRYIASIPQEGGRFIIKAHGFGMHEWEAFFAAEPYPLSSSVSLIAEKAISLLNDASIEHSLLSALKHDDHDVLHAIQHCHHLITDKTLDFLARRRDQWLNGVSAQKWSVRDKSGRASGLVHLCRSSALRRAGPTRSVFNFGPLRNALCRQAAPPPISIGPSTDDLQSDSWGDGRSNFWQALIGSSRRLISPSLGLCMLSTVRNEGIYLLEWIAYHKLLGVEHFFIYTNDNEDGSNDILEILHQAGHITLFHNIVPVGGSAQNKAYAHALSIGTGILDYEWCAVLDADEFFRPPKLQPGSMRKYLKGRQFEKIHAVAVNWRNMSPSVVSAGQFDGLVTADQIYFAEHANAHIKCIIRPQKFVRSSPHVPQTGRRNAPPLIAADGNDYVSFADREPNLEKMYKALSTRPICDPCYIAHYLFKSVEEFAIKRSRNGGDLPLYKSDKIMMIEPNQAEHFLATSLSSQCCAHPDAQFVRLLRRSIRQLEQLPGMQRALLDCRKWNIRKLSALKTHYREKIDNIENEHVKIFAELLIHGQSSISGRSHVNA